MVFLNGTLLSVSVTSDSINEHTQEISSKVKLLVVNLGNWLIKNGVATVRENPGIVGEFEGDKGNCVLV